MYGLALIEISDNITAHKTSFVIGDRNESNYDEYITDQVNTEDIPQYLSAGVFERPDFSRSAVCTFQTGERAYHVDSV